MTQEKSERIAKYLARAGLCSRREAERWIAAGRVAVNGETLTSPALNTTPEDSVEVDGQPVGAAEATRLWLYHKPSGLVTTHRDPEGRKTVFEALPKDLPRVVSVGRLDLNSEGLLLLTNDGALADRLARPETGWLRRYRVRVYGKPSEKEIARLLRGVTIDGVRCQPAAIEKERDTRSHSWLIISLREGKNREIRRLFEAIDMPVTRLIRLSFGPFQLGRLPRGEVREVSRRVLREQVGA